MNFLHQDINESNFSGLVCLANELSISGLFIFMATGPNEPNIPAFYNHAFSQHWLRAFGTHVMVIEKCEYTGDPCISCAIDNGSNWNIDQIIYMGDRYEIFP